MSDANKALLRRYYEEVWNQQKLDLVDDIIDPKHIRYESGMPTEILGPEGVRKFIQTYITAFPDLKFIIEDIIAEGDRVAVRWIVRGTHYGNLKDIQATGNPITIPGISFSRIENGKIMEHWTSWDTLLLLTELGFWGN
jgi:steroid delta-isomerase-like uncharacterized protein